MEKIIKGTVIDLRVEKLAFGGKAVARVDGFVVFLDHAVPGQTVKALITRKKRNYAEDISNFVVDLYEQFPLSARYNFTCVIYFFSYHGMELSAKELKFIRRKLPNGNTWTIEKDLDIDTI